MNNSTVIPPEVLEKFSTVMKSLECSKEALAASIENDKVTDLPASIDARVVLFYLLIKYLENVNDKDHMLEGTLDELCYSVSEKVRLLRSVYDDKGKSLEDREFIEVNFSANKIDVELTDKGKALLFPHTELNEKDAYYMDPEDENPHRFPVIHAKSIRSKKIFLNNPDSYDDLNKILANYDKLEENARKRKIMGSFVFLIQGSGKIQKMDIIRQIARKQKRNIFLLEYSRIMRNDGMFTRDEHITHAFAEYELVAESSKNMPLMLFNAENLPGTFFNHSQMKSSGINIIKALIDQAEEYRAILCIISGTDIKGSLLKDIQFSIEVEEPIKSTRIKIWSQLMPELNMEDIDAISEYALKYDDIDKVLRQSIVKSVQVEKPLNRDLLLDEIVEFYYKKR